MYIILRFINVKMLTLLLLIIFITNILHAQQEGVIKYLSMEESINMALTKNNQLRASKFEISKARWDQRNAWTRLLPSVNANTRFMKIDEESFMLRDFFRQNVHTFFPGLPSGFEIPASVYRESYYSAVEVSVPIFNGILLNGLTIANVNKKMATQLYNSTRNNVVFQVISAYLNVLRNRDITELQEDYQKLSRLNYEKAERLYEAGRYSKSDMLRWKVDYQQQKSLVVNSRSNLRSMRSILGRLINSDIKKNIQMEENIPDYLLLKSVEISKISDDEILVWIDLNDNELIKVNASLSAAQSSEKISRSLYRNSYSSYLPNVDLTYTHAWRENNTLALDDYSPKTWMVNFNMPLFTSFQNITATKSAYYEYKKNKEQFYDQLKNTRFVLTETANKIINLKTQRELSKASVEFSEHNYRVVAQQKEKGLISNIDFIDAKLNLQNAKLNDIGNDYDFISAIIEMYYLLGKLDQIIN